MRRFSGGCAARWPVQSLLLLLLLPWAAGGQEPLGAPLRERAQEARERVEEVRLRVLAGRAELGVVLGGAEQVDGRTGVRVMQALPGRPAARAGIQAGDVLISLNGAPLGEDPGRRVTDLMAAVEPGDTVVVVVHREGSDRTVRVATERRVLVPDVRLSPELLRRGFDAGPVVAETLRELRLLPGQLGRHRLELVAMNPGLGRYFGVEEGVLVANVAEQSGLGLQAGDVILSIGGRAVRDPAHARSILASYRPDEEVELQVMRDRRRVSVRGSPGEPR